MNTMNYRSLCLTNSFVQWNSFFIDLDVKSLPKLFLPKLLNVFQRMIYWTSVSNIFELIGLKHISSWKNYKSMQACLKEFITCFWKTNINIDFPLLTLNLSEIRLWYINVWKKSQKFNVKTYSMSIWKKSRYQLSWKQLWKNVFIAPLNIM